MRWVKNHAVLVQFQNLSDFVDCWVLYCTWCLLRFHRVGVVKLTFDQHRTTIKKLQALEVLNQMGAAILIINNKPEACLPWTRINDERYDASSEQYDASSVEKICEKMPTYIIGAYINTEQCMSTY